MSASGEPGKTPDYREKGPVMIGEEEAHDDWRGRTCMFPMGQ